MMATDRVPAFASKEEAWREHNLSQLRYFRSLSLREKFLALEGMADVIRRLEETRAASAHQPQSGRDTGSVAP